MIVFIVGPTGVGKSDAACLLAHNIGGEIVSCDAMQVYREVNVACDKPSKEDRQRIPHHMLDVVSVTEEFDVAAFRRLAIAVIDDIISRGKVPIVVGGSGMYVSVLLDGIFESGTPNETLRGQLYKQAERDGSVVLHNQLTAVDPEAAAKIHANDVKRIVRALEVNLNLNKPISKLQKERDGLWGKYPIKIFALNRDREKLYARVEARIDRMFTNGLVEEVRHLSQMPLSRSAATLIGIPEVSGFLKGEYDLERAKYLMKLNTRHYAKRQLTWFRRDERLTWIDLAEGETVESVVARMDVRI